ncbi:MAG: helicase, partial [Chloroflexi bacterium]|nr:helicase [Chloroflexota bacterium]
ALGAWVGTQRGVGRSEMPEERVKRFESFADWVWDLAEAQWEEAFSGLERYYEEHGSARVPQRFKTKDGIALGTWINNQRRMGRNEIPAERVKRLESFEDWVWDAR